MLNRGRTASEIYFEIIEEFSPWSYIVKIWNKEKDREAYQLVDREVVEKQSFSFSEDYYILKEEGKKSVSKRVNKRTS